MNFIHSVQRSYQLGASTRRVGANPEALLRVLDDDRINHVLDTVELMELTPAEQLRAALKAAEELEQRGIDWNDAWRNPENWGHLDRINMLVGNLFQRATEQLSADFAKREERRQRQESIHLVKAGGEP